MSKMEIVSFQGASLEAVRIDETVWVSVRRMCEALGLAFHGQYEKLSASERTPWACVRVIRMHDASGRIQEAFCLDLDSVPMWLATIDVSRVAEHIRPNVVLFQKEAARALRDHFFPPAPRFAVPTSLHAALRLAADLEEERASLLGKVAELAPKAAFADRVTETPNALPMGAVAKLFGMGRQTLFDRLRALGIIERKPSTRPYQEHLDAGRFVVNEVLYTTNTHGEQTTTVTRVTGKGQVYLAKRLGLLEDIISRSALPLATGEAE
jgi:phage antirepressor YoqD-like protein